MTAEGEVIKIVNMDDRHLYNTIRMLDRWADAEIGRDLDAAFRCSTMFSGNMAEDMIEQEIDNLMDMRPQDYAYDNYKVYPRMIQEAAKRGLSV
ncbi:hypothetical protein LCGC14_0481610 [marine sediment metagenome]|uniref:Uncharacterized protein n=1 Tax=marine sediment metagenome TaxID=412755 RepID=A0A0F9UW79_9ZZZZ